MKKTTTLIALATAAAFALGGCSSGDPANPDTTPAASQPAGDFTAPADGEKGSQSNPIKVGIVGPELEYDWLKETAEAEGLYIEYVTFSDYTQANPALSTGELDLNQFQHLLFLGQYNVESGSALVPLASTAIYPLPLYSKQYTSVDEIPQGSQIAIPNDETNQARAISVLASAGLLTLKDGVDPLYATPLDIDEAASKVTVTPVAAEQTSLSLDDPNVAGAIINNNWAKDAGLDPTSSIAKDDPSASGSAPFINVWAGSSADQANDPAIAELLRLAKTDEFNAKLQEQFADSGVLVDKSAEELQQILTDVETQIKAH
ncbi:MAG: methionine ABC transporter substrate-binding protein [Propionibacteriaceae bacterium]|jgi:D-methionine transport system substrate-binding protein|nr:methionine ABC transporter substrate-binding protein [Propionibacteriaceae bacterium]